MGNAYAQGLPTALERGLIEEHHIDTAVRRVLALKADLGLFDDPYGRFDEETIAASPSAAHRALAREAARKSIVLLTNKDETLPLEDASKRLAVIGPLADAAAEMLGPWAMYAPPDHAVSLLDGMRQAFGPERIDFAAGVAIEGGSDAEAAAGIGAAVDCARQADVVILCLGEALRMSGEAASRGTLDLPGHQAALARAVLALDKPVIVILSAGRPITADWLFEKASAVLVTWFLGSEAGHAVTDVLSGQYNPSGRLPVTWPVALGQVPIFHSRLPTGRPASDTEHYSAKYRDLPVEPLFSFGQGLSYTRFTLSKLRADADAIVPGQTLTVTVEVANQGRRSGETTQFLFIRDPVASVSRPLLELKGVAKATLAPSTSTVLGFTLTTDDLTFIGADLKPCLEPGAIELYVGPSADPSDLLTARVTIAVP
jgi:beta-glucosidase